MAGIMMLISACGAASPEALLTASTVGGQAPLSVTFTNNSQNADEFLWNFGDGATTTVETQGPVTHEYTKAGTFTVILTALSEGEGDIATTVVTVEPGLLNSISLDKTEATLAVEEGVMFSAQALDQFDNVIPGLAFDYRAAGRAGQIDSEGRFTAGTRAGIYGDAIQVEVSQGSVTRTAMASVTVEPGPLDHVTLEPETLSVEVGQMAQLSAMALDRFENPIPGLRFLYRSGEETGRVDTTGEFTAGTKAEVYRDGVEVEANQGSVTKTASVTVTVEPGPLDQVAFVPEAVSVTAGEVSQLHAVATDQFSNPITGLTLVFKSEDQAGQVDDEGRLTVGTTAGMYEDGLRVEVSQGSITRDAAATVTIEPGALAQVLVSPRVESVGVTKSQEFTAVAGDSFGNEIPEAVITWKSAPEVGFINSDGLFSAGLRAGHFDRAVTAIATLGSDSIEGFAFVTVTPDPLDRVTIPAPFEIAAGKTDLLEATAMDRFSNVINNVDLSWTVLDTDAGSTTAGGVFTANEVAGAFVNAVEVQATQGDLVRTVTSDLTVTPGTLDRVVVAPDMADIGIEMTQQFVAVGVDQFGNRVPGLDFTWSVEEGGGGAIDTDGLFTAGTEPGTYTQTVKAVAVEGGSEFHALSDVLVRPDRIAFLSDRTDDTLSLYLMAPDGSDVERVARFRALHATWAPNGRRIAFENFGNIVALGDDGEWLVVIHEVDSDQDVLHARVEPAWSPDGSKIAFVNWTIPFNEDGSLDFDNASRDIWVVDIDGGNLTQLTDTSNGDEWVPTWSPDGTQIVYDFTPTGENGFIWVMNADGSNKRQLTTHVENDTSPSFSPSGDEIAFTSSRDGDWEIYLMNADGSDIRQLTSNEDFDTAASWSPDGSRIAFYTDRDGNDEIYVMNADGSDQTRLTTTTGSTDIRPAWSPRKRGVEVSEDSIVISDASHLEDLTAQAVTAQVRGAVVRVETNLGSGSGFIIDSNGLIVTNNHVISDATEITIFLEDGTSFEGSVLGRDLVHDLAVVQIDATDLPTLKLGDLSQLPLASEVIVAGYPLGVTDLTITTGLVSSIKDDVGRNIIWVQTDAAVNPGNSGGPILNLRGEVVGIVTSKFVDVTIEGVGFAISINTIKLYLDVLLQGETIPG